jgi:murein L,D-transpeptidase YafK
MLSCKAALVSLFAILLGSTSEKYADRIIVEKAKRRLILVGGARVLKEYRIALGTEPTGHKQCQGDNRTPEGVYVIDSRNLNSQYHRALHISYPNDADRRAAKKRGCKPGGDIMIHGLPKGYSWLGHDHSRVDWTQGCIAVTNAEIEEIWKLVRNGTRVLIKP